MKKIGILVVILAMTLTSCSLETEELCPALSSERISADLAVGQFNSFSISGTDIAHLKFDDYQAISVNAHEGVIDAINTEVTNSHWQIEHSSCGGDQLANVFNIQVTDLASMSIYGNSELGSPDIMEMKKLSITAEDSGLVTLTGKIQTLVIEVSDNAILNLNNFQAENIIIRATGNSKTKIYATNSLEAIVKDQAEVIYQGGPRIYSQVSDQGVLREN